MIQSQNQQINKSTNQQINKSTNHFLPILNKNSFSSFVSD